MEYLTTIFPARFDGFGHRLAAAVAFVAFACTATAEAQILSAPHDTRALPPVRAEGDGVNLIASGAVRGVERVYDALMPEASGAGVLNGLREGQTVAVHSRPRGEALDATEGTVTNVNRRRAEVSIRFDDRTTETFRVARQDVGDQDADASRVLIYYPNAAGEMVGHAFVRVSQARSPRTH